MAAIAVEIGNHRAALARRPVPGQQRQPVRRGQRDLAEAEFGERPELRPRRVRQIQERALRKEKPADHQSVNNGNRGKTAEEQAQQRTQLDQSAGCGAGTETVRRARTLSDFSWPQAAKMSRPRGVRTGAE